MRFFFTLILIFSIQLPVMKAQQEEDFVKLKNGPKASFFDVQKAFTTYWETRDKNQKGKGWKAFKRWEYMMRDRVDATGRIPDPAIAYTEWKKYHPAGTHAVKVNGNNQVNAGSQWSYLGPNGGVPANGGAGRITCMEFHPNNTNTIFVGAPAGGLWKTTDGGLTWSTNTDELSVLGISDIAINPSNPATMYVATGDRDGNDTYSAGVLKSTDGGLSWNTTGLLYAVSQQFDVNSLLIHPTSTSTLFAATSNGIFKSTDAGVNWVSVKTGGYKEICFKPGDPTTIYAIGTSFARSTDGGNTWTTTAVGLPTSVSRMAMAVTAADPNYIYVIAGQPAANDYGFDGIYRSTNGGTSFTKMCGTPNVLGWNSNGNDTGGQAWYDLTIAASPANKDFIVTGGVNIWKSTNGGTSMQIMAHWTGNGAPYVHADVHTLEFLPGSGTTVFAGCDGGFFKTANSGSSWTDLSKSASGTGLQIGQMYRLGVSQSNANLTITGWQDNGTSLHNNGTSSASYVLGGDGMECIIDYNNANIMYGEQYNGSIQKSTNGGGSFPTTIANTGGTGVNEDGDWVTPYILHPTSPATILVGKKNVYRSTNSGSTWSTLTLSGGSGDVIAMAYAPSNPNYIYVARQAEMHISTNGTSFTNLSTALGGGNITYICVDPTNPQRAWYTSAGYTAGNKVHYTSNAGTSWSNVSANLPNVPVNTIVYEPGSNDGLYVGTDIGVFYKNAGMANWILYSDGLPNVIVKELEIQKSSNKLRAATFGRGLWQCDLYTAPVVKPVVAFSSNKTSVCKNGSVNFSDNSTNLPSSWAWSFGGGTPATSGNQFPSVTYTTPGTYPVKLVATNAAGTDSLVASSYITVLPSPAVNAGNDVHLCKGDTAYLSASGGVSYSWTPTISLSGAQTATPYSTTTVTRVYTVTAGDANGCTAADAITVFITGIPATPFISLYHTDSLYCTTSNVHYQWYLNGTLIPNDTTQYIHALQDGNYTVTVSDTAGCGFSNSSTAFNYVGIDEYVLASADINVFPNPTKGAFDLVLSTKKEGHYLLRILNPLGESVYSEVIHKVNGSFRKNMSVQFAAGAYLVELTDIGTQQKALKKFIIINP